MSRNPFCRNEPLRVRLRAPSAGDFEERLRFLADPEAREGLVTLVPPTRELARERCQRQARQNLKEAGDFVIELLDGRFIGVIGYYQLDWKNRTAMLGTWLGKAYQGQGYGTEAKALLLDFLFYELGLHSVGVEIGAFHVGAIRGCEKLGFQPEGRRRSAFFRFGRFHDMLVYGLLRSEWEERSPPATVSPF